MGTSVKIMLSYDYCHFEICKSTDQPVTDPEINELRKDVQRLADEAVRQYMVAKSKASRYNKDQEEKRQFLIIYNRAILKKPEELTIEEKATIKQHSDESWEDYYEENHYDYDDDDRR